MAEGAQGKVCLVRKLLRHVLIVLGVVALSASASAEPPQTPAGYWKVIDDKTGRARAIAHIEERNGELVGRIEKLLEPTKGNPNPICTKCPGTKRGKPVIGLEFLWGFKRESKGWSDGYVLDPEEGRTYHGNMELHDGGRRLKLFGYVRVIVKIGRSQVWVRAAASDAR